MRATRGKKKIMKTTKKRWARYALPEGFAERGYPKDSSCHTISKSMMDQKNPRYGYQTTYKQYKYSEEQEQQQCKVCSYTSPAQCGPG
jgi:NADH:ubiquinone oxidoreductase subunit E